MLKVVIIGAGPIGCYLAQLLTKKGINSLLIEEHKEIGKPVHCAGLLGAKVFKETKIPIPDYCILNEINGAVVYYGNEKMKIKRKNVAYVVDREKFDKSLGKGLNVCFETKFLGIEKKKQSYIVETDKENFETDIIIGADGANSSVREFVIQRKEFKYLKGVQFRIKKSIPHENAVQVYIKNPYFYWIIPEGKEIIRMGVISDNPYQDILKFIKETKIKGEVIEKFAGKIPTTYFMPISRENIFLVGDSACQVKPLTHGGIYMGMRSAEILADCIVEKKFAKYPALWIKRFGKEIMVTQKARDMFRQFPEEQSRKLFLFVKKNKGIIEKMGDFEKHSSLIWELLKKRNVFKEVIRIFLKNQKVTF